MRAKGVLKPRGNAHPSVFWTKTQPVISFWLEETELSRSATASSRPVGETLHATGWPRAISGSVRTYCARWRQRSAYSC
jgi:hypothetical protein